MVELAWLYLEQRVFNSDAVIYRARNTMKQASPVQRDKLGNTMQQVAYIFYCTADNVNTGNSSYLENILTMDKLLLDTNSIMSSSKNLTYRDWKYSQSCWYFRPSFVNCCSSNLLSGSTLPPPHLPCLNKYTVYTYTLYSV